MTLQFVILKPITATISLLLLLIGGEPLFYNSYWQLIMLTAYNVSYTLALYGLFLFYVATKDEMNSFSPVRKFLAVKSVVFMTYWQMLFIPIIFGSKYSDKTNDFILCLESVAFAFLHYRAFPWWEFKYKKIPIDKVEYRYTGFGGLDDVEYTKFPDGNEEKELEVNEYKLKRKRSIDEPSISEEFSFNKTEKPVARKRRRSSVDLAHYF
eukprot:UN00171